MSLNEKSTSLLTSHFTHSVECLSSDIFVTCIIKLLSPLLLLLFVGGGYDQE